MNQDNIPREKVKLSVIVLFYYGEPWIKMCSDSLQNQSLPGTDYEIILVDNGGSTPSVATYSGQPNIKVLTFSHNLGFTGGNNKALSHAEGELVFLINQDVVVHYDCLRELVKRFEHYPEAGIVSANMLMASQKDSVDPRGPLSESVGCYRLTRMGYANYEIQKTDREVIPVDFASGSALGFRKRILGDVGNYLFDRRLGSYAEDLDLCIRLSKTNWKMYVCPQAVVYHYRDDAFSGTPLNMLRKLLHVSSNRLQVYYNNLPFRAFLLRFPALMLGVPFKVARPDGARRFDILKFLIAIGCVPIVAAYFGVRLFKPNKDGG
ncbi:MAG: glycosyltransferase family 2 protein [Deltaproteobacteria bacterium]|jgi:GT2 family glycosyltransferase|nr:glycosyltransferase family 2 protein [Deltaproteobacteria bacterium]